MTTEFSAEKSCKFEQLIDRSLNEENLYIKSSHVIFQLQFFNFLIIYKNFLKKFKTFFFCFETIYINFLIKAKNNNKYKQMYLD